MAESQQRGQMSDEELLKLIETLEEDALGSPVAAGAAVGSAMPADKQMTTLQVDQYNALNTFYARPNGTEIEGQSSVVLPEMRDTVMWELPLLMRIFTSGPICQFDPTGPQDVKAAALETAAVNHIFLRENNGFLIAHDAIMDARMLRNGYARVMVETRRTSQVITHTGLTQIELARLLSDKADEKVEILGQRQWQQDVEPQALGAPQMPAAPPQPGPPGQPGPPPQGAPMPPQAPPGALPPLVPMPVWDIKIRRTKEKRRIRIDCMPPEEMLVSAQCRGSLDESPFIQHHSYKTRSDLIETGYDEDEVNGIQAESEPSTELVPLARMVVTDQLAVADPSDRSMQTVCVRDIIIRCDYDGDGVAELRHVVLGHRTILANDEIDEVSYVGGTTTRMPHRHTGLSAYDDLGDIQAIKTDLARGMLGNARLVNNPPVAADFNRCAMEDLLVSRDGGVVRTNGPPGEIVMPFEYPFIGDKILPIMETVDSWREMRTGVGKDTVGVDMDALQDVTKGGQLAGMAAASLKIELKARLLAETLFAPLFCKIHSLIRKHPDTLGPFQHRGQWVQLDPLEWDERESCSPAVGLGSGQREEMRQNLMLLEQLQEKLFQAVMALPPPAYRCAWNSFTRACELLGFTQPEQYGVDPDSPEYAQIVQQRSQQAQQLNPAVQVAQIKNQGALQVAQTKLQQIQAQQFAEDQRMMLKLNTDALAGQAGHLQGVQAQALDHAHAASQAAQDRQTEVLLAVAKMLAPIVASQLKGDPGADAGQILASDTRSATAGGLS